MNFFCILIRGPIQFPRPFFIAKTTALLAAMVLICQTLVAEAPVPQAHSGAQADAIEEGGEATESPRERGRVLQKRNPIASEYQVIGVIGQAGSATEDAEGSDYRSLFPTELMLLDANGLQRIELSAAYQNNRRRILPGLAVRSMVRMPTERPLAVELDLRITDSDRYIDQYRSAWALSPIPHQGLDAWILERPRFSRDRIRTRVRNSRFRAEYEISPQHTLFAHLIAGDFNDHQSRNRYELNFSTSIPDSPAAGVDGLDFTYLSAQTDNGSIRRNFRETNNRRTTLRSMLGGRHTTPLLTLDYSAYASRWTNRPRVDEWNFTDTAVTLSYRNEDPDFPAITIESKDEVFESSNTRFSNYRITRTRTVDEDNAGRIDAIVEIGDSGNWLLMSGLLYREKTRTNRSPREVFDSNPSNALMLASVARPELTSPIMGARYTMPPWLDVETALFLVEDPGQPYLRNPERSLIESYQQRYQAFESVAASYLAFSYQSSRFDMEIGLRPELTRITTSGTVVVPTEFIDPNGVVIDEVTYNNESLVVQELGARRNYSDLIGSAAMAFRPFDQWQFRAAAYDTLMRPQYYDTVEYRRINLPRREISEGNPSLTPTYIRSFVISVERSGLVIGDIGFELNHIDIRDFFYAAEEIELINGEEFTRSRIENGESGNISGFQLQWQLDMPPIIRDVQTTLSSAYTYSHSEATVATRPGETLTVPERSRHLAAAGLNIRSGGFTGRLEYSYQSSALESIGESAGFDIYRKDVRILNSSISYQSGAHTFSLSVTNLLNHPERSYIGEPNRIIRNLFTSQIVRFSFASQW